MDWLLDLHGPISRILATRTARRDPHDSLKSKVCRPLPSHEALSKHRQATEARQGLYNNSIIPSSKSEKLFNSLFLRIRLPRPTCRTRKRRTMASIYLATALP